jgi:glycosyltransferase involved in cell wall biosynthesis
VLTPQPRVSVLMAVFNAPSSYISSAVESILAQTLADFEFVIIDDGSNSHTRAALRALATLDRRIKLHTLNENIGLTKALNVGLRLSRGMYIARQDADDMSMPNRLELSVGFLDKNRNIAAVGTFAKLIGPEGDEFGIIEPDLRKLHRRNVMVHGSVIFRKACVDRIGGYNEIMRLSQDYEIFLRMVRQHSMQLAVIPELLYALRRHTNSISRQRPFSQFYFSVLAKTLTAPVRSGWRGRINFLKIFVLDFLRTLPSILFLALKNIFRRSCRL